MDNHSTDCPAQRHLRRRLHVCESSAGQPIHTHGLPAFGMPFTGLMMSSHAMPSYTDYTHYSGGIASNYPNIWNLSLTVLQLFLLKWTTTCHGELSFLLSWWPINCIRLSTVRSYPHRLRSHISKASLTPTHSTTAGFASISAFVTGSLPPYLGIFYSRSSSFMIGNKSWRRTRCLPQPAAT